MCHCRATIVPLQNSELGAAIEKITADAECAPLVRLRRRRSACVAAPRLGRLWSATPPFAFLASAAATHSSPTAAAAPLQHRLAAPVGVAASSPIRKPLRRGGCRRRSLGHLTRGRVFAAAVVMSASSLSALPPRWTLLGRGNQPSRASSALGLPRGKKMYRLRNSRRAAAQCLRHAALRVHFCLPWVFARLRAPVVLSPPFYSPPMGGSAAARIPSPKAALATLWAVGRYAPQ